MRQQQRPAFRSGQPACRTVEKAADVLASARVNGTGAAAFVVILNKAEQIATSKAVVKAFDDVQNAVDDDKGAAKAAAELRNACAPYVGT